MKNNLFVKTINKIESILKFPNLKSGETGIQVGFDLSSRNLSTDVIRMHYRTTRAGKVIAIDPDPQNHAKLQLVIDADHLNVSTVMKATYSRKVDGKLMLGANASHNKLDIIESADSPVYTDQKIEVEMDTLDNIIKDLNIDYSKIRHICITNNGAEYETLLGMDTIFEKCDNLCLTIASGRPGKIGEVNGRRDHEVIIDLLTKKGFSAKLVRLNKSFWQGFVVFLILKRRWIFNKPRFGYIVAARGERKLKSYQLWN